MDAQNSLVYALESAKWRQVLGKEPGLVNPWERQLFKDLLYPGDITSQEIYDRTLEIFHRYFRYRRDHLFSGFFSGIRERFRHHFFQRLPRRLIRSDDLNMGRIGSVQGSITPRQGMELLPKKPSESAADYNISKTVSACPYIRRRFPFSWKTFSVQMLTKTAGCILQMESSLPRKKKMPLCRISPGFGGTKAKK